MESKLKLKRCSSGGGSYDDDSRRPHCLNECHRSNQRSGNDSTKIGRDNKLYKFLCYIYGCANNGSTTFGDIRHNPEIMMRIYSYLPLGDRICRLSLVDKAFSRDKIRGGIVCGTYGGGFNLKQALLELLHWAVDQLKQYYCHEGDANANADQLQIEEETEKYYNERITKICSMLKAANLNDGELLLFTGSNLTNSIVTPSQRRRWMTSYVREFFGRERQQWDQQQQQQQNHEGYSWLTEVVLVQIFLKRYFFDGNVNQLEQLMADADFLEDYEGYIKSQMSSKNHVGMDGNLVWCLPNLYHGCILLLLDPDTTEDGGWKEHRFVTCRCCRKLHEHVPCNGISCDHGQYGYFCDKCCDYFFRFMSRPAEIVKTSLVCDHCAEMHGYW